MHPYKGIFVVFDGPDGSGKGVMIDALVNFAADRGKSIFDLDKYLKNRNQYPKVESLRKSDVILASEPTYWGVGKAIREEIIRKDNPNKYSAYETGQAYALDRAIHYRKFVLPVLEMGKTIIQSRSVASSLVYQPLQAKQNNEPWVLEDFITMEGNRLALANSMDLLLIPFVNSADELINRLNNRTKTDNVIFEVEEFLGPLQKAYADPAFRAIFEKRGTIVKYIDAGVSEEFSATQAADIFEEFLELSEKSF